MTTVFFAQVRALVCAYKQLLQLCSCDLLLLRSSTAVQAVLAHSNNTNCNHI
jgi:hypothetical protein